MTTTKARTGHRTAPPTMGDDDGQDDPYLSPTEVAKVLGFSRKHATYLMHGVIPGVVDLAAGGERAVLRVRRSALQAWVDSRAL